MSYTTEAYKSSGLTTRYPSYYKEFQIVNWTSGDIVVTEHDGSQTTVVKSGTHIEYPSQCVVIEQRTGNCLRIKVEPLRSYDYSPQIELPATRINIPLRDINAGPVRVPEHNIIISSVEQSAIAKSMVSDMNYGIMLRETPIDSLISDPRLVFQVIDPDNEFDSLYLSVFGQTILVSPDKFFISKSYKFGRSILPDNGRLICYLKYPYRGIGDENRHVVFDISLAGIEKKEPFQLPNGELIGVATCIDDLNEIKNKIYMRTSGQSNMVGVVSERMISKEVYDSAVRSYEEQIKELEEKHKKALETRNITTANEIAKLRSALEAANREKDAAIAAAEQWKSINKANSDFVADRLRTEAEYAKLHKEMVDVSRRDTDAFVNVIKVLVPILTSALSFAFTVLAKSKK